jgi:hypothetical protein
MLDGKFCNAVTSTYRFKCRVTPNGINNIDGAAKILMDITRSNSDLLSLCSYISFSNFCMFRMALTLTADNFVVTARTKL